MSSSSPQHARLRTRLLGALGTLSVLSYAVFAAVQIQVLNPLDTVPGAELREIHAAVGRTADTMGWGLMIALLLPGPVVAAAAGLAGARGRLSRTALAMIMLGLLTGGSPIYLLASFPAGMTLADTFGVGGADHAPWALILHTVSLLAVLALAALVILQAVQTGTASAAHRSAFHARAAAFAAPGSTAAIRSSTSGVCAVETNQASKADGGR